MTLLFLRKLHFYWLMFNMALWFFVLYPPLYYFSRKPQRYWGMVMLRRWWARLSSTFAGVFFRFEFEEPVDWSKTYVICPYHSSNLDTLMISLLIKHNHFCFMGKDNLKSGLLTGIYFRTVDLPVDRDNKMSAFRAFRTAVSKLADGISMIMFPEGGIADEYPPRVQDFKNGPFRLAIDQKIPILPISSIDTWKVFWDDGLKYGSRPGICHVIVHRPIQTEGLAAGDEESLKEKVRTIIENRVSAGSGIVAETPAI